MFIRIGVALSISTQYLQLRGSKYQFRIRVPKHLARHYDGRREIRKSLGTSDSTTAVRQAEALAQRYLAEFKLLTEGKPVTPQHVIETARELMDSHSLESFIQLVAEPARDRYADGNHDLYDDAEIQEFLSPAEFQAYEQLSDPQAVRLSDALMIYFKHHQKGADAGFVAKVTRDWNTLMQFTGDIRFSELSRQQVYGLVDLLKAAGKKTSTIRRTLNALGAVFRSVNRERELGQRDPFEELKIQGEGDDEEKAPVATVAQLQDIANSLMFDFSPVALVICIQLEIGARIGEVSGLGIDDLYLDAPIPHIHIRSRPWRSLKTRESERRVPVVGIALEALKRAAALPRAGLGVFEAYAKPRGNDNASAAANKRLLPWKLTTHSFRHTLKDRLREVGCPKDIRDAIQGHANGDVAETYGQGHTLRTMHEWLQKVAVKV
jgi:integrase